MSIKLFLLSGISVCLFSTVAQSGDTVSNVQNSWGKTKTYQAKFHQVITAKRMGSKDESTGEVTVKKPGKIRWDEKSEGKIQILNGKRLIHIQVPKRRKANVVDIYENVTTQLDIRSLSFLSGTEEFKKAYTVGIISQTAKSVVLKFVPKGATGSDTYIAEFDKSSYLLRSLVTESADTSVRTDFSEVKSNHSVPEELFDYKPGPTDVVTVNK